ncbi:hypothetical protein P167DRAFT_146756 [Morchella conica CCBAS932]|uniref:Uncharacterized protein n=1 Tax=Morchella conica CCBAS932 TaxID=1392247 RepID=A0A3N4KTX6_9PEZI|nr:hypothetical protein P167DRAFT_146756 [Morchella conica CCBAS932]
MGLLGWHDGVIGLVGMGRGDVCYAPGLSAPLIWFGIGFCKSRMKQWVKLSAPSVCVPVAHKPISKSR